MNAAAVWGAPAGGSSLTDHVGMGTRRHRHRALHL